MSENASHVIIHHYIENAPNDNCSGVACCIILIAVVVVLFLIVAGVIIYILVYLTRHRPSRRPRQPPTTREMHGYDNTIDDTSRNAATAATSTERDVCDDGNAQSIPMTTFRTRSRADGGRQDATDSSAGLYDVLFPEKHEGEVIYDPPTKLMTFAGQVYASRSRPGSDAGPSGSGQPCDSESLVWDYFQQSAGTPVNSEVESDVDSGAIDNICWV